MKGEWIKKPVADTAVIFIHGFLSDGASCWRHESGAYWPNLLCDEPNLSGLGIYVFTYQTDFFSGSYRLGDVVDALKEQLKLDEVLDCRRLMFVCHSMGGLVARKFIVERAVPFLDAQTDLGLFLIASPSLGSHYANWLKPLAKLFGHSQAAALRFSQNNDWLNDLDKEFKNLIERMNLKGKELIEDKFITLKKLGFFPQVVEPFAGARYFSEQLKVPQSDHFSIAKPADREALQHRILCKFMQEFMLPPVSTPSKPEPAENEPTPPPKRTADALPGVTPHSAKKNHPQDRNPTALSDDPAPAAEVHPGFGTLSWLHLADLGFCAKDPHLPDPLKKFETDVIAKLVDEGEIPDLVLISGDITRNGSADDFALAEKHMRNWANRFDHHVADSWFLVPGDQDVELSTIGPFHEGLRDMLTIERVSSMLADEATWTQFAARQAPFLAFTERFLGRGRAWLPKAPWRTDIFAKGELRLAVLCLNSAWCAQDEPNRGNLLLGRRQLDDAFARAEDAHMRLALLHHPTSWLKPFESASAHTRLTGSGGCGLIFFADGDANPTAFNSAGNKGHHFSASLRPTSGDALISFGKLDLDTGQGQLRTWTYSEKDNGFWTTANLSSHTPGGLWTFAQEPLRKPNTPNHQVQGEDQPKNEAPTIPNRYQRFLNNRYGTLETLAIMDQPAAWRLQNLYVPLKTDWLEPEKQAELQAEQARQRARQLEDETEAPTETMAHGESVCPPRPLTDLAKHATQRHFLIEGHPGGGKSTFLRYTALNTLEQGSAVPILLSLKDFGSFLAKHPDETNGVLLRQWAAARFGADYDVTETFLERSLGNLLWLLDGLDELFDTHQRRQAAEIIGNWCHGQGDGDRVLVTSRPHALTQPGILNALGLTAFKAEVLSLDEESQDCFLANWFGALYGEEGKDRAQELHGELWHALESQPITADMRGNPLMLSVMATIYHQGRYLPERRADLYERAIELMLSRRFGPDHQGGGSDTIRQMRQGLEQVALAMQKAGLSREIARVDFMDYLTKGYYPYHEPSLQERNELAGLAERLESHSGMLEIDKDGSLCRFAHRGYQEYLAARCLAKMSQPFKEIEAYLDQDSWREVILLIAGYLFQTEQSERGKEFLEALRACCGDQSDCARLALVVRAAAEAPRGSMVLELERSLKNEAVALIESGEGEEKDRAELGLALGRLGDLRIDASAESHWVRFDIPQGWKDEKGKSVTEPHSFLMARYPVTNAEYRLFIKNGGYATDTWWSQEGLLWKNQYNDWLKRFDLEEKKYYRPSNKPRFWLDEPVNESNQPVVGISYYEAEAYCAWLTNDRQQNQTSQPCLDWQYSLPSGAMWYFAAAGANSRKYPWNDQTPTNKHANFEANLGKTSPVGLYPKGASPEGLFDMGGNVWEWCCDEIEPKPDRVLRGGSWFNPAEFLAASFRIGSHAGYRDGNVGFRLAVLLPREHGH